MLRKASRRATFTVMNIRRANERGHAEHGWLDCPTPFRSPTTTTRRTWASGALRVINDDRVAAGPGFGTHAHRDMEILSYVLEGGSTHKDSMGTGPSSSARATCSA